MKRIIKTLLLLVTLGVLSSCGGASAEEEPNENIGADFEMKAIVTGLSDRIEVDVYEAEYEEGIFWLVVDNATLFVDSDGKKISRDDLKIGDKIAIEYSGQVMMSYPPQVYAIKITKL